MITEGLHIDWKDTANTLINHGSQVDTRNNDVPNITKAFDNFNLKDQHVVETFGDIDKTLEDRGNRYGVFSEHARITQNIKRAMSDSPNWLILSDDKKETLEMIAHKVGRILNGDPEYKDSWHDIIGYSKLIDDTLSD